MKRALLIVLILGAAPALPGPARAAAPPQIPAAWVTGVTTDSAVLHAEVDPEGLPTRYQFQYLALAAYEANLAAGREGFSGAAAVPAAGSGLGAATAPLAVAFTLVGPANPLTAGTAYSYRAIATNSAGPAAGAAHTLRTKVAAPPAGLPDGRGWELVSPVEKDGGAVGAPGSIFGGGDFQAAAGGGSFTFSSTSSFGAAASAPPASQYVSTRGAAGWATRNVSAPTQTGGYGEEPDGAPFRLFSGDLSRALMLDGARCAAQGTCPPSYSLWQGGAFAALPTVAGLRLAGATADLGHVVFEAESGLYEWGGGGLEALAAGPAIALAAPVGAISEDGRRVYAYQGEDGPISLLEVGRTARALPGTVGVGARFQSASADGSTAFFTVAGHLYRYDAVAQTATDITPAGGVVGVLAVSPSGADVYYQDGSGLWRWHEGARTEIAAGTVTVPGDYPPAAATVRLGAGGAVLAFLSAAPLGYDNTDADTGLPDTELYLYDADTGSLLCASCNPTGERPTGSASIPGALRNGTTALYRPRVLSADGRRLFFDTADVLTSADTDSAGDVYEWEADGEGGCTEAPGCVGLLSGGRGEGGRFLDASETGEDVFFLTGDSLLGADPGSIDVYDARVGGGFPEPEPPFVCKGDACQALPGEPEDPTPGTLVPTAGNPPLKVEVLGAHRRTCPKGKRPVRGKKGSRRCVKKRHHGRHHARRHQKQAHR